MDATLLNVGIRYMNAGCAEINIRVRITSGMTKGCPRQREEQQQGSQQMPGNNKMSITLYGLRFPLTN